MSRQPIDIELMRRVVVAAAPERTAELDALLADLKPGLFICGEDARNPFLHVENADILFSSKAMEVDWLLTVVAWKIFRAYSPAALLGTASGQPLSELLQRDAGLAAAEEDFRLLLLAAHHFKGQSSASAFEWPEGIPTPQSDKSGLANVEDQAANDIYVIAFAYSFLHELHHVWHFRHPPRPTDKTAEEMDCDVFARGFLLDRAGVYAGQSGEVFERVANKRAMGIALGAWIVYELTPAEWRGGSPTHPPAADRLEALIRNMPVRPNADFWVWVATLLMAAARHRAQSPDPVFDNAEGLAMQLLEVVRTIA